MFEMMFFKKSLKLPRSFQKPQFNEDKNNTMHGENSKNTKTSNERQNKILNKETILQ